MGAKADRVASDEVSDAELQELLDAPESAEEQAALDALVSDPEEILRASTREAGC